jgi:hypothetical protein
MVIEYIWDCRKVEVYPIQGENEDVVYLVNWILIANSTDILTKYDIPYSVQVGGIQQLDTSTITDFIPIWDLENEQVTTWVVNAMGIDQVDIYKLELQNKLEQLITPTSVSYTIDE